jgi:hypothetical protein
VYFLLLRLSFRQDGAQPQELRGNSEERICYWSEEKLLKDNSSNFISECLRLKKKGHAYKNAKYISVPWSNLKHHVTCSEVDDDSVYISISKMAEPYGLPMMF